MASPDGSGRGLRARLDRLERLPGSLRVADDGGIVRNAPRLAPRPLPVVLPDGATVAEVERLRAAGIEAVRFIEFVEGCV